MKKGQLVWENIAKWVLVILFIVIVLLIVFSNNEKLKEKIEKIKDFLIFGGDK